MAFNTSLGHIYKKINIVDIFLVLCIPYKATDGDDETMMLGITMNGWRGEGEEGVLPIKADGDGFAQEVRLHLFYYCTQKEMLRDVVV